MESNHTAKTFETRNIIIILTCNCISTIGDCFNDIALISYAYLSTKNTEFVGSIFSIVYISMIVSSSFAGVIVDRLNKKVILIVSSFIQAIAITLIIILPRKDIILLGLFIETAFAVLVKLSLKSIIKQSVEKEKLQLVNSLSRSIVNAAKVVSPIIAGIVMALWQNDILHGTRVVLIIDVASFIVCTVGFLFLKLKKSPIDNPVRMNLFREYKIGFNTVIDNRKILELYLFMFLVAVIGTFPFLVKTPFIMDTFNGSTVVLGGVNSSIAVGAIVGSFLLIIVKNQTKLSGVYLCRLIQGISYMLLSFVTSIPLIIAIYFLNSGAISYSQVIEDTYQQVSIKHDVLGKTLSLFMTIHSIIVLVTLQIAGKVTTVISSNLIMLLSGFALTIISILFISICHFKKRNLTIAST